MSGTRARRGPPTERVRQAMRDGQERRRESEQQTVMPMPATCRRCGAPIHVVLWPQIGFADLDGREHRHDFSPDHAEWLAIVEAEHRVGADDAAARERERLR